MGRDGSGRRTVRAIRVAADTFSFTRRPVRSGFGRVALLAVHEAVPSRDDASARFARSVEHTSELQSLMRISYAVVCLKKKKGTVNNSTSLIQTSNSIQA